MFNLLQGYEVPVNSGLFLGQDYGVTFTFCFRHFGTTYIFLQACIAFVIRKVSEEVSVYKFKKKSVRKKESCEECCRTYHLCKTKWPLMPLGALPLPHCVLLIAPLLLLIRIPAPPPPTLAIATTGQSLKMEVPQL